MAFLRFLIFVIPVWAAFCFVLWTWKQNVWTNRKIIAMGTVTIIVAAIFTAVFVALIITLGA